MNERWLKIRTSLVGLLFVAVYVVLVWVIVPAGNYRLLGAAYLATIIFLVGQYFAGKRFALESVAAERWNDPIAQQVVADLSEDMGIPKPELKIGHFGSANAFAVGRKGNGVVVVSATLVEILTPEELDAVIAHELSHLKSRDVEVMLLGQSLDVIIYRSMSGLANSADGIFGTVLAGIAVVVGTILRGIVLIPLRLISRYREYIADHEAADYTGNPHALASALAKIQHFNIDHNAPEPAEAVNSLCIFSMERSFTERALGTHPPINDRVDRLNRYANGENSY